MSASPIAHLATGNKPEWIYSELKLDFLIQFEMDLFKMALLLILLQLMILMMLAVDDHSEPEPGEEDLFSDSWVLDPVFTVLKYCGTQKNDQDWVSASCLVWSQRRI